MSAMINIDNIQSYKDLRKHLSNKEIVKVLSSISIELDKKKKSFSKRKALKKEMAKITSKMKSLLLDALLNKYSDAEKELIKSHWESIFDQACINIGIKEKDILNTPNISLLLNELDNIIIAIEAKGFIPYSEINTIHGEEVKNFVKYLLHDISVSNVGWKNLKSILIKKDETFLNELREEFNHILQVLYKELKEEKNHHEDVIEMFIGHILSTYALTEPENGMVIKVPQKIEDNWQLINYVIEPISLTPSCLGCPVDAYGLMPLTQNVHPMLIFKSTPHPTGKSSLLAMMADFTPGFSVGEGLYKLAKKKLATWVRENHCKYRETIKVYGQSLGGSLAYFLALDHKDHVEIHTYLPAGLMKRSLKGLNVKGKTFSHNNDIVGLVNNHPEDLTNIRVLTQEKRNPLIAHFRLFGCDKTILLQVNAKKDNKRFIRRLFSVVHQVLAFPLFLVKSIILLGIVGVKQITKLFRRRK